MPCLNIDPKDRAGLIAIMDNRNLPRVDRAIAIGFLVYHRMSKSLRENIQRVAQDPTEDNWVREAAEEVHQLFPVSKSIL